MCKLRSVRETARIFKDMDPDTQLTEHTIRKLIAQGQIPTVSVGRKFLINVDTVLKLFGETPNSKYSHDFSVSEK